MVQIENIDRFKGLIGKSDTNLKIWQKIKSKNYIYINRKTGKVNSLQIINKKDMKK